MEWCIQSSSKKYLFKYVIEGSDHVAVVIKLQNNYGTNGVANQESNDKKKNKNEIKDWFNCKLAIIYIFHLIEDILLDKNL